MINSRLTYLLRGIDQFLDMNGRHASAVGAELATPSTPGDGDQIIIAGRDSLQDTVNQVGQEMTRRNPDIKPTLTQHPGLPLRVIVNRDLP